MSKKFSHFSDQYLSQYAETETIAIANISSEHLKNNLANHTLIIPAFNESDDFLLRLKTHPVSRCFFILVINSPDNRTAGNENNQRLHQTALNSGEIIWQKENLSLIEWPQENYVILVDRFSNSLKLPEKQGVGLARKIACDIAIQLIKNQLLSTRFIHSSDADAFLPDDYFLQTDGIFQNKKQSDQISGAVYRFEHSKENTVIADATHIYEQSLHYYVDGLRWANSHYAFHTIGSCLAIFPQYYCQVRGFPKKSGGEDFYLLNKLAKLGNIISLKGQAIHLQARASNRVPFGTGPAVSKIIASQLGDQFPSYDPGIFIELKKLLSDFSRLSQQDDEQDGNSPTSTSLTESDCHVWLDSLTPVTRKALVSLAINKLFHHLIHQCKHDEQRKHHILTWFDAFKTLKFIHFLQEHALPAIPLNQALKKSQALGFAHKS